MVVVAVYYNIGFRIEPKNRTGFAHLSEHRMFEGSKNSLFRYAESVAQLAATYRSTYHFPRWQSEPLDGAMKCRRVGFSVPKNNGCPGSLLPEE